MDENSKTVIRGYSGPGYQYAMKILEYENNYHIIIISRDQEKSAKAIEKPITDTCNKNIYPMDFFTEFIALQLSRLGALKISGASLASLTKRQICRPWNDN